MFWLSIVIGGAFFLYQRFAGGNRGGRTLGGGESGGVGGAVGFAKDMLVVGGIVRLSPSRERPVLTTALS